MPASTAAVAIVRARIRRRLKTSVSYSAGGDRVALDCSIPNSALNRTLAIQIRGAD